MTGRRDEFNSAIFRCSFSPFIRVFFVVERSRQTLLPRYVKSLEGYRRIKLWRLLRIAHWFGFNLSFFLQIKSGKKYAKSCSGRSRLPYEIKSWDVGNTQSSYGLNTGNIVRTLIDWQINWIAYPSHAGSRTANREARIERCRALSKNPSSSNTEQNHCRIRTRRTSTNAAGRTSQRKTSKWKTRDTTRAISAAKVGVLWRQRLVGTPGTQTCCAWVSRRRSAPWLRSQCIRTHRRKSLCTGPFR